MTRKINLQPLVRPIAMGLICGVLTCFYMTVLPLSRAIATDIPFSQSPITIDGFLDDASWSNSAVFAFTGAHNNGQVTARMTWDQTNAYFGFTSADDNLWDETDSVVQDDSFEFYLDLYNDEGSVPQVDDIQFAVDIGGNTRTSNMVNGLKKWEPRNVVIQTSHIGTLNDSSDTDTEYTIEMQIPWTELITPYNGRKLGLTFGNSDDDDGGSREGWKGLPGISTKNPSQYLDVTLTGGPNTPVPMYSNTRLSVKNYNLGDPAVVFHDGRYYMVESPHEQHPHVDPHNQIIMYSSPNLVDWDYEGIVFEPSGGAGAWNGGNVFAPDISVVDNEFYIGYSATPFDGEVTEHRVAVAHSSTSITGPYTATTSGPLFDTGEMAIDSHIEEYNGESYIYWTQFGGSRGISVAKLNSSFTGLATSPQLILTQGSNEDLVEAPWTYERDGTLYIFYSANEVNSEDYRIGYATSTTGPTGPFTKGGHILVKSSDVSGPGHNSIVESPDGTETFIVYHKWVDPDWDASSPFRRDISVDRLYFREDGSVFTFGPTLDEHPLPSGADGSFGVFAIENPGFETDDLSGWTASSSAGSTSHIFTASNFDPNQVQEGQYHLGIENAFGPSKDGKISQTLTGLEGGAVYRMTAWTRNSERDLIMGVTPEDGVEVSQTLSHSVFGREELDFLVQPGYDEATIWFDAPAGSVGSWVWIDAVEVFKILDPIPFASDFDGDGDVDGDDLVKWQADFGQNGSSDADKDGDSDGADFLIWQQEFGSGVPAEVASAHATVPEPSALTLFCIAAVGILGLHDTRQLS